MRIYETLSHGRVVIDRLDGNERRAFERIYRFARRGMEWSRFANESWREIEDCYASRRSSRATMLRTPLYQIAEDLEARLALSQGKAVQPDYRLDLDRLIRELGTSRYRLARQTKLSQALLSRVLAKQKNLSIESLSKVLDALGRRLAFVPKADGVSVEAAVFEVVGRRLLRTGRRPRAVRASRQSLVRS